MNGFADRLSMKKYNLNPTDNGLYLYRLFDEYMQFYNKEKRHIRLDNKTPN